LEPAATVSTTDTPSVDERVLTAAAPVTPSVMTPANTTASVPASDVANQIAQQVDLYRLPGNKGVRIQLHPEDLGGVQVTLKYAAGGSLELHISVEHASTGALVQEGIGQLRDALATQGFHPDRLVMSVTAPASANQMDFNASTGGGSYRPDGGLASFMQGGQSDQQRDSGGDTARGARDWSDASSPATASDTQAPAASSGSAASSRIDYRV